MGRPREAGSPSIRKVMFIVNGAARFALCQQGHPQPAGWGSFIPAYKRRPPPLLPNPPTGRLGIVHSCLQSVADRTLSNPPTGRLGSFYSCLQKTPPPLLPNPPTGRLGIVHSCLQKTPPPLLPNPPPGSWGTPHPAGWESFIPA